jgi:hypothetical protein
MYAALCKHFCNFSVAELGIARAERMLLKNAPNSLLYALFGLWASGCRAWHCSGEKAPQLEDAPVGLNIFTVDNSRYSCFVYTDVICDFFK